MANNDSALENARSRMNRYKRQRRSYLQKIADNKAKIKRLQTAKKKLKSIKDSLKESSKSLKKTGENEDTYYEWSGEKQNSVAQLFSSDIPAEYSIYINRVDIVLDSIVEAETELENENLEMHGIVGRLSGWINNLAGEIEQLTN